MSLIDDLLAEKRKKAIGTLNKKVELKEPENIIVLIDKLDNEQIIKIIETKGTLIRVPNPTTTVYTQNLRNKSIATILLKNGNPEV